MHGPADHQTGAEARPEVQTGEGAAFAADGEAERGGVGVLVDHHRHAEPGRQHVPQRETVPLGKARDPVQHPARMIERTRERHPDAERSREGAAPEGLRQDLRHLAEQRFQDRLRPRAQGQRGAPLAHHSSVEVDQHHPQFVPVEVDADRVTGLGDQPQDRARLAAGGRAPAGVRRQSLLPQPGGDLADRLWGETGAFGELQPADALGPGCAQQVEHERGVVAAQGQQVHARGPARHGIRRTLRRAVGFRTRLMVRRESPCGPRAGPRRGLRPGLRRAVRVASVVRPLHPAIVPRACTLATALPKWLA